MRYTRSVPAISLFIVLLQLVWSTTTTLVQAYYTPIPYVATRRNILCMKRGRGSSFKEIGGDNNPLGNNNNNNKSTAGLGKKVGKSQLQNLNWCTVPKSETNVLPTQPNKIAFLDTNLPTLKDGATNPTGAVAVVKSGVDDQYYCFRHACPSCQIPLTKAEILAPSSENDNGGSRLVCNFCQATYSLKNGQKLPPAKKSGLIGGIVNKVFSSKDSGPLPIYKLAERNNDLLIALEQ